MLKEKYFNGKLPGHIVCGSYNIDLVKKNGQFYLVLSVKHNFEIGSFCPDSTIELKIAIFL